MATRYMLASVGGRSGIRRSSASSRVDEVESSIGVGRKSGLVSRSRSAMRLLGKKRRFVTAPNSYKPGSPMTRSLTRPPLGSRIVSALRRRLHTAWPVGGTKTATAAVVAKKVSSSGSGGESMASEIAMATLLAAGTTASFALSGQVASRRERSNSTELEAASVTKAASGPMTHMTECGEGGSISAQPSVKSSSDALHGAQLSKRSAATAVASTEKVRNRGLRKYARFATRKTRQRPKDASVSFHGAYDASVGALMGNRSTMEDSYYVGDGGRFVAVFDGHGGCGVSSFLQDRLYKSFVKNLQKIQETKNESTPTVDSRFSALSGAFNEIDQAVMKVDALQYQGSTACAVVVHEEENGRRTLLSANVGDSRAILSRRGRAIDLTRDHKPNDETELERITSMGEKVTFDRHGQVYRVRNLAIARSIGDRFAKPVVSGDAEVLGFPVSDKGEDEFVILASDGLWDVMSSQEVVSFVHKKLCMAGKERYQDVRNKMTDLVADEALRRGSDDNICVALVWLK